MAPRLPLEIGRNFAQPNFWPVQACPRRNCARSSPGRRAPKNDPEIRKSGSGPNSQFSDLRDERSDFARRRLVGTATRREKYVRRQNPKSARRAGVTNFNRFTRSQPTQPGGTLRSPLPGPRAEKKKTALVTLSGPTRSTPPRAQVGQRARESPESVGYPFSYIRRSHSVP